MGQVSEMVTQLFMATDVIAFDLQPQTFVASSFSLLKYFFFHFTSGFLVCVNTHILVSEWSAFANYGRNQGNLFQTFDHQHQVKPNWLLFVSFD